MFNSMIKIYKIFAYMWSIMLFVGFIAAYVCVYDIKPFETFFSVFYTSRIPYFDITFYMLLLNIALIIIKNKFFSENHIKISFIYYTSIVYILFIVHYLRNV